MDESSIYVIVIFSLLGIAMIGLAFGEEQIADEYKNPQLIMDEYGKRYVVEFICELKNIYPFYDCPIEYDDYFDASGSMWAIVYVEDYSFFDITREVVYGYAVYNNYGDGIGENNPYSICHRFPAANQTINGLNGCNFEYLVFGVFPIGIEFPPYKPITVFNHELKHLKCQCNWHKGLNPKPIPIIIDGKYGQ